jgi:hypothetical protein
MEKELLQTLDAAGIRFVRWMVIGSFHPLFLYFPVQPVPVGGEVLYVPLGRVHTSL